MRLLYYRAPLGNFGDDLNAWLWEEILPDHWSTDCETLFTGIGTIIGNPMPPAKKIIVFSSGAGYSPIPSDFHSEKWQVAAVRGPLTVQVLGLDQDAAVADGALLLSRLPRMAPLPEEGRSGVVFVPHHAALEDEGWRIAAELAGVELLDPRQPSKQVIQRLRSARLVIADSMHAAIIADTLRVPWIPVVTSNHINTFKWLDWSLSLEVAYEPVRLPPPSIPAGFHDWAQKYYQPTLQVDPPTAERAISHFHRTIAAANRCEPAPGRKLMKLGMHKVAKRLAKTPLIEPMKTRANRRCAERTATALSRLRGCSGYLSDERILRARAEELSWRLGNISKMVG